jgi:two-component system, NtrC family, sensor histidine kinase HydH
VAVWFLGFATYLVIRSRREIAVRERLRHAEEVAHLLEKSEKVLDNIPVGVAVLSEDGRVTAVNRALRERVPDPGAGTPLPDTLPGAGAEVTARLAELVDAARRAGAVRSMVGARLPLFGRDGRYTVHAVPLEPSSADARALLVVEDVTELHSVTMQLLRAEKLATVGVLAAGIAHEIGTPLGVVRGRAEMLAEKLGEGHPQTAGARIIVDEIDRVSRVIRQLLDFTRVRPADLGTVTVASVARAVAELLRFELERRKVTLSVEVADDLDPVAANPDHLQQVLVNLVLNACDACAAGGRVAIRARRAEPGPGGLARAVRIEVVDDGCGIPEELRHQVFDPFFTTKKRGQGTGLGLTVAAQIVRNHGGEIDLESEPRRGTRVVLRWPAAAPAQARERTHELRS